MQSGSDLIAAWFGGTREGANDVGIWVSRHVDDKWQAATQVVTGKAADGTQVPCWNPVLFQPNKGPLMLFYKVGPKIVTWQGMLVTSHDGGKSWSAPHPLPNGILGPIKNKPLELNSGRILCGSSDELGGWRTHFEWSDDNGATWARTGPLNDGVALHAIQASLLNHGNGTLQGIGRTRAQCLFSIFSHDNGATWGQMELLDVPNPNSGTDAVTLQDGRHLLVCNPVPKGRSPLCVMISADGRTWQSRLTLEDEPKMEFSYPAVMQTTDGRVHVTYTWKRKKIRHVVLDANKLR